MSETIHADDARFITRAADYLENPSFLIRVANQIGHPLEMVAKEVPTVVQEAVDRALKKVLELAIRTVPAEGGKAGTTAELEAAAHRSSRWHTMATAATGAAGGLFGFAGLLVELPLSTSIMFRSIARVAQDFGEDLTQAESRLECLTVFSLGGRKEECESPESAYLATRMGLALAVQQAAQVLTRSTMEQAIEMIARGTLPPVARLLAQVAGRFSVVVSEKVLAQSIPLVGAAGGAFVNGMFTDHFSSVARYHFGIRKLERQYGIEPVQAAYREAALRVAAIPRSRLGQAAHEANAASPTTGGPQPQA